MVLLMVIPQEREEFIRKDTLIVLYRIAELFRIYIVVSARPVSFRKALLKVDLVPQTPLKRSMNTRKLALERLQDYLI
nr:unnamed protein product [Callosobruchus chinensis]